MFHGLLASARELRNPLLVGYSAMLAFWLLAGEAVNEAALADPLGRRLVGALDSSGDATKFALYTFAAAMIGSLLWNGGVSRLVRFLSVRAGHPDWDALINEAREAIRRYEEYQVTTHKGSSGGQPSSFDAKHQVPSPRQAAYLHERVEERERKAAEMSFRVTLAVALAPVAIGLGVEGGGLWWWWLSAIPVVWFDVALLKYTTLRTVRRYELEDVQSQLKHAERWLTSAKDQAAQSVRANHEDVAAEKAKRESIERAQEKVDALKTIEARLLREESHRLSKIFAFLEGQPSN